MISISDLRLLGYSYCHSCTDYQALMPRTDQDGYDSMNVCAYCIDFLTSTFMVSFLAGTDLTKENNSNGKWQRATQGNVSRKVKEVCGCI